MSMRFPLSPQQQRVPTHASSSDENCTGAAMLSCESGESVSSAMGGMEASPAMGGAMYAHEYEMAAAAGYMSPPSPPTPPPQLHHAHHHYHPYQQQHHHQHQHAYHQQHHVYGHQQPHQTPHQADFAASPAHGYYSSVYQQPPPPQCQTTFQMYEQAAPVFMSPQASSGAGLFHTPQCQSTQQLYLNTPPATGGSTSSAPAHAAHSHSDSQQSIYQQAPFMVYHQQAAAAAAFRQQQQQQQQNSPFSSSSFMQPQTAQPQASAYMMYQQQQTPSPTPTPSASMMHLLPGQQQATPTTTRYHPAGYKTFGGASMESSHANPMLSASCYGLDPDTAAYLDSCGAGDLSHLSALNASQSGFCDETGGTYGELAEDAEEEASAPGEPLACYVCRGRRMCFCYFLKVRYYKFPSFLDLVEHQYKKWQRSVDMSRRGRQPN